MLKLIDFNENFYRQFNEKKLKDQRNSQQSVGSLAEFRDHPTTQSVVTEPQLFTSVKYPPNTKETCIANNSEVFVVGTSTGVVYVFDIKTLLAVGIHKEDFSNVPVTSIDIHPRRPNYCVVGFEQGQISVFNLKQPTKTVKLIKDHHK